LTRVAGEIATLLGGPQSPKFKSWLKDSIGKLSVKRRELFGPLRKLGPLYLTTNYDSLLEDGLGGPALTWREPEQAQQAVLGDNYGVVHVHGYWEVPESLVLGPESYDEVANDAFTQAMLRHLVFSKCLLFIGVGAGLSDRNFTQLRDWMRPWTAHSCYAHFRLVRNCEMTAANSTDRNDDPRIIGLAYGDDYGDLPSFLDDLTKHCAGPIPRPQQTRWRTLEWLQVPMLSTSSNQLRFALNELAMSAVKAYGTSTPTEFAVLYRVTSKLPEGAETPTPLIELRCHKVHFLAILKERLNRFYSGYCEIKERGGSRDELVRFLDELNTSDFDKFGTWKQTTNFSPDSGYRTMTLTIDPESKTVSVRTDANDSLSPSAYATHVKTTSDVLRFTAAGLRAVFATIDFDSVIENPDVIDILVDILDKVGIDFNALRFNAEDDEQWAYMNTRFKKEIGELFGGDEP
jgi:SIR2-like domain